MGIFDIFRQKQKREFFPETMERARTPILFSAEKNPTAAACIDKISNTLAKLPLKVYERTSDGLRIADKHNMQLLLADPSTEETPTLFYSTWIRFMLNKGNAYLYKLRGSNDEIIGLQIVNPQKVEVSRDERSHLKMFLIDGKYYTERDIIHIPYNGPGYNGIIGYSPVDHYRELIGLDNRLLDYVANYFDNSTGSRMVVKLGNTYPTRKASMDQLYAEIIPVFNKFVVGAQNAGKPMISLPDSDITKIEQTSNVQAQLKSMMDMVERQIAQTVFNMPFEILNSEASKYDSLETKQNDFLASCIEPLGNHICQTFEMQMDPTDRIRYKIAYEYKNLLTTNTQQTIDYLCKEFLSGALTMNEFRQKLGMPSMGEAGDYHFIPANLMPLTMPIIDSYMAKSKAIAEQSHNPQGDDKT